MDNRLEEAKNIIEGMNEDIDLAHAEELIKDNNISFEYKNNLYRVHLLTYKEKVELDNLRRQKFGELMQDKNIMLEKTLIEQYKIKGIDIQEEIDNKIKDLSIKETNIQLKLGESLSKKEDDIILKEYKDQIEQIQKEKKVLSAQRALLLEFSLETQLMNYVSSVICYLCLDKMVENKWERIFKTLDEFENYEDEGLLNKAGLHSLFLQF